MLLLALLSCAAPAGSSSQPTGETPETIAGVRLGERVADYSGNFYVAESVSISDEAVSVGGSFWISGIEAKRFYAFADFNYRDPIVSGDSADYTGAPISTRSLDSLPIRRAAQSRCRETRRFRSRWTAPSSPFSDRRSASAFGFPWVSSGPTRTRRNSWSSAKRRSISYHEQAIP